MKIDPKKIARMITEDPDEVAPDDHFDDFEDEYEGELGFCDGCLRDIDYNSLSVCENCGWWWCEICMGRRSGFDYRQADMSSCPNCAET